MSSFKSLESWVVPQAIDATETTAKLPWEPAFVRKTRPAPLTALVNYLPQGRCVDCGRFGCRLQPRRPHDRAVCGQCHRTGRVRDVCERRQSIRLVSDLRQGRGQGVCVVRG